MTDIDKVIRDAEQVLAEAKKEAAPKPEKRHHGRAGLPDYEKGQLVGALKFGVRPSEIERALPVTRPTILRYRKLLEAGALN